MADIEPTSIDSEEAFESPTITLVVEPTSIDSEEAFESPTFATLIDVGGVASEENFGIPQIGFNYVGDGIIYMGSIGSNTPVVTLNFSLFFGWSVNSIVSSSLDVLWDVGELPNYWFRVLGDCRQTSCPTSPIDLPQPCGSYYMTMVLANSPKQVCEKLARSNFAWRIAELGRFSTPADNNIAVQQNADGIIDITCNKLESVPFCQLPECLPFCLSSKVVSPMGAEMYVYDAFLSYRGTGGIHVGGTVAVPARPDSVVGSGGITMSGSAEVTVSNFSYVGSGGINISGSVGTTSTQWYAQGSGGIVLGGSGGQAGTQFNVVGSGGISMSGTAASDVRLVFVSSGFGSIGPSFMAIQISGVAVEVVQYYFVAEGSGGINMGGSGATSSSNYNAAGSGGIVMGGEAGFVSSAYTVVGSGGIIMGGDVVGTVVIHAVGDGGILIDGSSDSAVRLVYIGQGGINISGTVLTNHFAGSGGIVMGGSAAVSSTWKGLYVDAWGMDSFCENLEPVFGVQESPAYAPVLNTIVTCNATLPVTLQVSHNLNDSAMLGSFLTRNGYTLPDIFDLTYHRLSETWRGNYHYRGRADETTNERWDIFVDWGCVPDVFGISSLPVWKFSFYILRQNDQTGEDFDTRIVVYLDPEPLSSRFTNDGIDLDIQINTITKAVNVASQNATVQSSVFFDNAGLFRNSIWKKQPFRFRLKAIGEFRKTLRYDIFPIFPKPGEYEVT